MAYTLVLFDLQNSHFNSNTALVRAVCLQVGGRDVQEIVTSTAFGPLVHKMWIEFETEEEAALFKLTHL